MILVLLTEQVNPLCRRIVFTKYEERKDAAIKLAEEARKFENMFDKMARQRIQVEGDEASGHTLRHCLDHVLVACHKKVMILGFVVLQPTIGT